MVKAKMVSFLFSPMLLLPSLATALPPSKPHAHLSYRDSTNSTNPINATNPFCTSTTWYIGNFHTYQAGAAPATPYLAFHFAMYDSTGSMGRASCSRIGTPGTQVDDLLYKYDPAVWFPCHRPLQGKNDVETGTGGRSDYEFQWNDQQSTLYMRGRGRCGQKETRMHKLEPLSPSPWPFSWFDTNDLGDPSINPVGYYHIYGNGGDFKMTHDGDGNLLKTWDS
jgi:hypothetical protein